MKFQKWYDNLDPHTKSWLDKQAIWHDRDMVKAVMFGIVIGFIIGALFV